MIENAHAHESSGIAKIVPPPEWHPRPSRRHLEYADADDYEISEYAATVRHSILTTTL